MGVRPNIQFSTAEPKLDAEREGLAKPVAFEPPVTVIQNIASQDTTESQAAQDTEGDQWKEFFLNLGIGDFLSPDSLQNFNNFLKRVDNVIKALTAVLKILRLLSSDFLNVARALKFALKQIVQTLQDLVDTFISTGVYACVIRPDDSEKDDSYIIPTWGSFEEFKSKIAAACLDRENPASPARLTQGNIVGGFIIGGLGGTNDPDILDTMIANLSLLSDLFGITGSYPSPPKNVRATPGYYRKIGDGTSDRKLGIRIKWSRPDSKGVFGYRVFRSRIKEGLPFNQEDYDEALLRHPIARKEEHVRDIQKARIYRDEGFEPEFVLGGIARDTFQFTDFDVEEGVTYYYSVMSVIKGDGLIDSDPWNRRVDSPLMSKSVEARASFCIPVSEIENGILSLEGDFISEKDYRFKWQSRTLRSYFGPLLDDMIDYVDQFTDILSGLVQTSSDAIQEYIDFLSRKIRSYIQIIQIITNIITILVSFRLRGSLLLLNLGAESGGIENFVDRIRKSQVDSESLGFIENDVTTSAGALASIRGYYFGLVTVFGYPEDPSNWENYDQYVAPYREEYNDVQQRLEDSQRVIQILLKVLLGKD